MAALGYFAHSARCAVVALAGLAALTGCRAFPEIEVSEARFDDTTPYPEFVPMDTLLEEPEAEIDKAMQRKLTKRSRKLGRTDEADTLEDSDDPLLDRLDALRARRDNEAINDPVISDELRARMEAGVTAPAVPEE